LSITNVTQFAGAVRSQLGLQVDAGAAGSASPNNSAEFLSKTVSSLDLSGAEYGTFLLKDRLNDEGYAYAVVTFQEQQLSALYTHLENVKSVADQIAAADPNDTVTYAALVEELAEREDQLSRFVGAQFHANEINFSAGYVQNLEEDSHTEIVNIYDDPDNDTNPIGQMLVIEVDFKTLFASLHNPDTCAHCVALAQQTTDVTLADDEQPSYALDKDDNSSGSVNDIDGTATYASRNPGTPAGTYAISGTDAAKFSIDSSGNVTGTALRYLTQSTYNFDILYTADGVTHTEAVTLTLTPSTYGVSETDVTVTEAEQITIANSIMSYLNAFAAADSYNGSFTLGTASINSANDYTNFEVDGSGNVQSKATYDVDFDNGQTSFDMDVTYTHSDGVQTYTDRLHIDLTNDALDDTDLVLASVDISTEAGAREAITAIGSVIDRMSSTRVIIGAKRSQLMSNLERLSSVQIQTEMARGRIMDADYASEAAQLAKKQLLSGAAMQMIQMASAQKRGLLSLLS